ncbi:MAG: LysM peptidoglycan-binding domain-containing protein [Candidatus Syntrophosphaera sp.]
MRSDRKDTEKISPHTGLISGRAPILALILLLFLPLMLAAEFQTHIVKKGDTLYSLGREYGVSVEEIKDLNGLADNLIKPGQELRIKETTPAPEAPAAERESRSAPPPETRPGEARIPARRDTIPPSGEKDPGEIELPDEYYHVVKPKENLYRIARNNGLPLPELLRINGFEDESHVIHPGDTLIIRDPATYLIEARIQEEIRPARPEDSARISAAQGDTIIEKVYVVQKNDNLYRIAKANNMTVEELKELNNLTSNKIYAGQKLYLAGDPSKPASSPRLTEAELMKREKIRDDLILPTEGEVTSEYGLRNGRPHKGIDIGNKAGTPVKAVLDGVVVFSGAQGGYGNVVVLEHPDFVMTVYAHNEKNLVKVDDVVKQGDVIAFMGSTGQSSGSHLHFEYRLKGKAINPRKVLPLEGS